MDDRFTNGFIAGILAAVLTGPLGFAVKYFKLADVQLSDFAGILSLGRLPETLWENIFAIGVDFMISAALGIGFAILGANT
jgi:hypothetical protein